MHKKIDETAENIIIKKEKKKITLTIDRSE